MADTTQPSAPGMQRQMDVYLMEAIPCFIRMEQGAAERPLAKAGW